MLYSLCPRLVHCEGKNSSSFENIVTSAKCSAAMRYAYLLLQQAGKGTRPSASTLSSLSNQEVAA